MVAGSSPDTKNWIRGRVPDFREQRELSWPKLSYATTVMVDDVDAHHERAKAAGATILTSPTNQPWGLRSYAAIDLDGHQWEFSQTLGVVEPEAWVATRIE
jgi:uncharacterized glyoxalase superfamily protein PhnB